MAEEITEAVRNVIAWEKYQTALASSREVLT